MSISGSAQIAGVAGWPVAHSLSPLLHGHWIEEYQLDAAYIPLAINPKNFAAAVEGLKLAGLKGLNVTIPHKHAAFALAKRTDASAGIARAANLLVFGEDGIEGLNTDKPGLIATLDEALGVGALKDKAATIWGAGGMARAAICALCEMGAIEIRILARDTARAEALARELAPETTAKLVASGFDAWEDAASRTRLLVNATSAGMKNLAPIALPLGALPQNAAVFDAVYTPQMTDLLARAEARGLKTIDGLGLLMHQAVPSFEAFFGIEPKVSAALRAKLEKALHHGE